MFDRREALGAVVRHTSHKPFAFGNDVISYNIKLIQLSIDAQSFIKGWADHRPCLIIGM